MFTRSRYSLARTLWFTRHSLAITFAMSSIIVSLFFFLDWKFLAMPWQPVSLIGTALAFYLGFKNNSSYGRVWEARKIWGGIVNSSRSFTVMARDFVRTENGADDINKELVHRHVAWLHVLALELRKIKPWEHQGKLSMGVRKEFGTLYSEEKVEAVLREYLDEKEINYLLKKGNRSSHLLSMQSKRLMALRKDKTIEHFRHLEMQDLITEFYTLQGKSERIKNFPLPRQYASGTWYFSLIFALIVPFAMLDVFHSSENPIGVFAAIPTTVICLWVYWSMDRIGEYSENPFEGIGNDVPITTMARGIEIDIRQMLDEKDLPKPIAPMGDDNQIQI